MRKLSFNTKGNAKLPRTTATFSLPAGHTCPGAKDCLARVIGGKLVDGKDAKFRCFSASAEAFFKSIFESRKRNFDLLAAAKNAHAMAELLIASLPKSKRTIRIHVSGDFFSQVYFDAWIATAKANPDKIFYAYTKSLPFWIARMGKIPGNFRLTASRGGKWNHLIAEHNLPCAEVVFSEAEAKAKALPIDHTDDHAIQADHNFALLIHGNGAPGSLQAKIHASGTTGYKTDYFSHKRN